MEYPELCVIPADHPHRLCVGGKVPDDLEVRMVGWLGRRVPITEETPAGCVDGLMTAHKPGTIIRDFSLGSHDCEVCDAPHATTVRWRGRSLRLNGLGHHFVRLGDVVYMCPELLLHYVLRHGYLPPSEFVQAVMEGTFMAECDLAPAAEHEFVLRRRAYSLPLGSERTDRGSPRRGAHSDQELDK